MKFKLRKLLSLKSGKKQNSHCVNVCRAWWGLFVALGWQVVAMPVTIAAEQVTLRLGPFEQAIAVSELETFAKTGDLPNSLQVYSSVLTPQVREVLNRRLQLDPKVADKFIADVSSSPLGRQFLKNLGVAVPDLTLPQLQAAVTLAARQANGINLVGVLKAYPEENITIDASSAIALALEFNPSALQSRAISPSLAEELLVTSNSPFQASFDPAAPGKATVKQETLFLQDKQRYRSIPVDIYYAQLPALFSSAVSTPSPLVVISPGFGADRKFFTYLARHLASYGLTVAALEHPDSRTRNLNLSDASDPSKLLSATEFINRPKDISFVLDELAKIDRKPGTLQGKLNTEQVSVIGHSLGGYTALAVAGGQLNLEQLRQSCKNSSVIAQAPADWLQCAAANLPDKSIQLRDRRVKSAIALNPLIGNLFGNNGLAQVSTPTLILASTDDAVTPILNHQLRPFAQLRNPKYLLTAVGGTHLSAGNTGISTSELNSSIRERRGAEVQPLRQLLSGVSLAFIKQLTPEAKTYAPFLTSAYAQSLSTANLGLRLNTQLPASIASWVEEPASAK